MKQVRLNDIITYNALEMIYKKSIATMWGTHSHINDSQLFNVARYCQFLVGLRCVFQVHKDLKI